MAYVFIYYLLYTPIDLFLFLPTYRHEYTLRLRWINRLFGRRCCGGVSSNTGTAMYMLVSTCPYENINYPNHSNQGFFGPTISGFSQRSFSGRNFYRASCKCSTFNPRSLSLLYALKLITPVCSASVDPQKQMSDPSGYSVTPHHTPAPLPQQHHHP